MTHPIFNARKYPFEITEATKLYDELVSTYSKESEIDLIYKRCNDGNILPSLTERGGEALWKQALEFLAQKERLSALPSVLKSKAQPPALQGALDAAEKYTLRAGNDPQTRDYILSEKYIVLDRDSLRDKLQMLDNPDNSSTVLLIRGAEKSGKSHGRYLIEFLARKKNEEPVYISANTIVTVEDLWGRLFLKVNTQSPAREAQYTTDIAWYQAVCNRLSLAFNTLSERTDEKRYWIIIDNIQALESRALAFLNEFVALMEDAGYRRRFRLVLIEYPAELPTKWIVDHVEEVSFDANEIEHIHIKHAIQNWCRINNKAMPEDEMATIAQDILARVDVKLAEPAPRCRLWLIHNGMLEKFKTFR